jgi:acetylornithine deacetylase
MGLDPAAFLRELVRTPSVSGEEAAAAELTAAALAAAGLEVERLGDNVIAAVDGGLGPTLLLHSHLDTVGAGPSWSVDPWDAEWRDGRLTGLGANDAKGCAVAMSAAVAAWAQRPQRAGRVVLALVAREETNNRGMQDTLAHLGLPDGAVTGEPTGLEVVRSQAGLAVIEAHWKGRSCHAAHAARVDHDNALLQAARELGAFPPALVLDAGHELLGPTTLVAAALHSGERHNRVPDAAEALFDGRITPPHDAAACLAALQERLPRAELRLRSDRLKPVDTPAGHPLVAAALAAAGRPAAIGSNTLSDMALLAGVPAVKCGPGETARSHTPDEFLLRAELDAGVAFYSAFVPRALEALASCPA